MVVSERPPHDLYGPCHHILYSSSRNRHLDVVEATTHARIEHLNSHAVTFGPADTGKLAGVQGPSYGVG